MCEWADKIIRKVFTDFRAEGLFPIDFYRTASLFANHSYRPLVAIKKNLNLRLFRVVFTLQKRKLRPLKCIQLKRATFQDKLSDLKKGSQQ